MQAAGESRPPTANSSVAAAVMAELDLPRDEECYPVALENAKHPNPENISISTDADLEEVAIVNSPTEQIPDLPLPSCTANSNTPLDDGVLSDDEPGASMVRKQSIDVDVEMRNTVHENYSQAVVDALRDISPTSSSSSSSSTTEPKEEGEYDARAALTSRIGSSFVRSLYGLFRCPTLDMDDINLFLSKVEDKLTLVLRAAVNDKLLPVLYEAIMKHQHDAKCCGVAINMLRLVILNVPSVKQRMTDDGGIPLILHTMLGHATSEDLASIPLLHICVLTLSLLVEHNPNRATIASNFAPNIFNTVIKTFPAETGLLSDLLRLHFSVIDALSEASPRTHLASIRAPLRVLALQPTGRLTPGLKKAAAVAMAASLWAVPKEAHEKLCELQPHPVRVLRRAIPPSITEIGIYFFLWRSLEALVSSTPSAAVVLTEGKGPGFLMRAVRNIGTTRLDPLMAACCHVMACACRQSVGVVEYMVEDGIFDILRTIFDKWGAHPVVLQRACNLVETIADAGSELSLPRHLGMKELVQNTVPLHISHFDFLDAAMSAIKALGGSHV